MTRKISDFEDNFGWSARQFGEVELGDKRRTKRAVKVAAKMVALPAASIPDQMGNWGDTKAAYRLFNEGDVTFKDICTPHWKLTRIRAAAPHQNVVLFLQDLTELDFTSHPETSGLGHIGDTRGAGFILHSCLTVLPKESGPEFLGLAYQLPWTRQVFHKPKEPRSQRNYRWTEADAWADTLEAIGPTPEPQAGTLWVTVGDCESDNFSFWRRGRVIGWHFLARVYRDRIIQSEPGKESHLLEWANSLPAQGSKTIELRARPGKPSRRATLQVAFSPITFCPPRNGPERTQEAIKGWFIRCWEESDDPERLEWLLYSSLPVETLDSAFEKLEWYGLRWGIEEYHKCLKTGCGIEKRQLTTAEGLLAVLGFLAIVAVRLLQLRTLSRRLPDLLATSVIPSIILKTLVARRNLVARRHLSSDQIMLETFWREVAGLGGFLGRKSDGQPGWQTLWRGWLRLMDMCWGYEFSLDVLPFSDDKRSG